MRKQTKTSARSSSLSFVIVAIVSALIATIGVLAYQTVTLGNDIDDFKLDKSLIYNEIDYQKSLLRPAIAAKEKLVVFPELGVALPYNDVTNTFQYYITGQGEMSVTSSLLVDHKTRQMSCSGLVRISTKSGTPYSPWEESAGSVKLANGKTIYIVAAKAFENNEASTKACESEVWQSITPSQVTAEFKKMRQY